MNTMRAPEVTMQVLTFKKSPQILFAQGNESIFTKLERSYFSA